MRTDKNMRQKLHFSKISSLFSCTIKYKKNICIKKTTPSILNLPRAFHVTAHPKIDLREKIKF